MKENIKCQRNMELEFSHPTSEVFFKVKKNEKKYSYNIFMFSSIIFTAWMVG